MLQQASNVEGSGGPRQCHFCVGKVACVEKCRIRELQLSLYQSTGQKTYSGSSVEIKKRHERYELKRIRQTLYLKRSIRVSSIFVMLEIFVHFAGLILSCIICYHFPVSNQSTKAMIFSMRKLQSMSPSQLQNSEQAKKQITNRKQSPNSCSFPNHAPSSHLQTIKI